MKKNSGDSSINMSFKRIMGEKKNPEETAGRIDSSCFRELAFGGGGGWTKGPAVHYKLCVVQLCVKQCLCIILAQLYKGPKIKTIKTKQDG